MRSILITALLLAAATACSSQPKVPRAPLGAPQHLAEADRHEADARALDERADSLERASRSQTVTCADQAVADQATSGGERLGGRAPCWTGERGAIARQRDTAQHLRADARAHRAQARALIIAANAACIGLPDEELEHSPFDHHEDIAAVAAEVAGGRVVGARIRFAAVPGLDAAWLRRSLTCHQALAAATGFEPTHLASCPAVLPGARFEVLDEPAGLVVVVTADDPGIALTIYARAEATLDPTIEQ
jgi:hypothetical protein